MAETTLQEKISSYLASALEKLHKSPVKLNLDDHPATANLMIVNPLSGKGFTNLFSTHPPVEQRIAELHAEFEAEEAELIAAAADAAAPDAKTIAAVDDAYLSTPFGITTTAATGVPRSTWWC